MVDLPFYFGIIFNLNLHPRQQRNNLAEVKRQIVDILPQFIEISCSIFSNDALEIYEKGRAGSEIANFKKIDDLRIEDAIKETAYLAREVEDAEKFILIFLDSFTKSEFHIYKKCFLLLAKLDIEVVLVTIGNSNDSSINKLQKENVSVLHTSAIDLARNLKLFFEKKYEQR